MTKSAKLTGTLVLVGGGKMGSALLAGWLASGITPDQVLVVEPSVEGAAKLSKQFGVGTVSAPDDLAADLSPEVVMFAVKPQVMADVVPAYQRFAGQSTVFLTIAAGLAIASYEQWLGADAAIVRAMPNTPAAVGRGATAACLNSLVTGPQRQVCDDLLRAAGIVHWLEDEDLIHAVTGLSGSG